MVKAVETGDAALLHVRIMRQPDQDPDLIASTIATLAGLSGIEFQFWNGRTCPGGWELTARMRSIQQILYHLAR
jgi:hypothetical protein